MDDDKNIRTSSRGDLAAREVAQLAFPGSRLVHEQHRDEGEGWGQDRELKTAMLRRGYVVDPTRPLPPVDLDEVLRGHEGTGGAVGPEASPNRASLVYIDR